MNEDLLRESFRRLRTHSAAGIDHMTKDRYAAHLVSHLSDLVDRLHRMAYRPLPVRRVYFPKPGTDRLRPLGIACLEDKWVQVALVRILEPIYESDFIEDSYGFRPGRGCHDALKAVTQTIERRPMNYIVEADIKGFFDSVDRTWLSRFLGHRIADPRVLRLIGRFLKAGVLEDGVLQVQDRGTIQGGVISPLLANVYLHYVLDLWFERAFKKTCRGITRYVRYADDYLACFQYQEDAVRFQSAMSQRLAQFGLETEPTKTKWLEFGRFAAQQAKQRGHKPETFEFLGFTHYCSRTRDGKRFRVGRKTSAKKFRAKLVAVKEWLQRVRTKPTRWIWNRVGAILRGHFAYYGVSGNSESLRCFALEVKKLLFKWLNRRGKRRALDWDKFQRMLKRYPLPRPRITVMMYG
jgi:group II intron reverse transcriptase/maturase